MRASLMVLVPWLMACGVAGTGADAGGVDAGSSACGAATCDGCCQNGACLVRSQQDGSACGVNGAQCKGCGTLTCFGGACLPGTDAGPTLPICALERPTTSCDDQGGASATKGTCVAMGSYARCDCAVKTNPDTGRCLGAPSGPTRLGDGGVCSLDFEACTDSDDCCNPRHTCFSDGCRY